MLENVMGGVGGSPVGGPTANSAADTGNDQTATAVLMSLLEVIV